MEPYASNLEENHQNMTQSPPLIPEHQSPATDIPMQVDQAIHDNLMISEDQKYLFMPLPNATNTSSSS